MNKKNTIEKDSFRNSNLIQLLKSFSREEKAEFAKYVYSPFNPRSEAARFFDELKKYFPSFDKRDFSKEKIFSELYPGKKYKDDVIRRLSSNLFKLGEQFIAYRSFKNDEYENKKRLLEYYSASGLDSLFRKQLSSTETYLEGLKLRNADHYYKMKKLSTIKAVHHSQQDATRKKFDNTQERITLIWHYAIIDLFSIYSAAVNDMHLFNRQHNIELMKPLMEIYEHPSFIRSSASEIMYYFIKLETDSRNDETFNKLKELVVENSHSFEKSELFGFYAGIHNYLYERTLIPGTDLARLESIMKHDFELVVYMLKQGIFTEKGVIQAEWFANIFLKAIRANEIEFAEKFISDYRDMLNEKERENLINYAYGELEISRRNFNKALSCLARIKFNNVWEKLRVNHMYTKIHYEMNNAELFYYITDSFRHIVRDEQSVNDYIKEMYENFIKYVLLMFKKKNGETKVSLGEIKKGVLNSRIAGNKWLLQKIDEYEKRSKN